MSERWLWSEEQGRLSEHGLAHPHQFDIHGGGIDLVFPHHENEIAQSRCAFHTPTMANFWMHNGFLQVEGAKMAKSLGNFFTIHELLADWPGEVLRLNMLRTHYRQPLDWTLRGLEESTKVLDRWRGMSLFSEVHFGDLREEPAPSVLAALLDDLNTPAAITELHGLVSDTRGGSTEARTHLAASLKFLGLISKNWLDETAGHVSQGISQRHIKKLELRKAGTDIDGLILARNAARKVKNFKEADRIRDELKAMSIELEDHKDGTTTWKVKQ
jgi:cysteinyl-tRNA synthetase